MRVEIEGIEELRKKLGELNVRVERVLREAVLQGEGLVEEEMKRQGPGPHMTYTIRKARSTRVEVDIGPDKEHWYYQLFESGAQPHEIEPDVKGALAFEMDGAQVIVNSVKHTGMAAAPFIRPALKNQTEAVKAAMMKTFWNAIERVAK
jgi:HK97 gp10 family phage protein